MKISKNIHRSAVTFNTKDYPFFLFVDISQKIEKIFIKVIQYFIFENLHINTVNKKTFTLFFDILYYTTIIYEDPALGFSLGLSRD